MFNGSTSWAYWTHYIRDPQRAGMLSWIGNQGVLGAAERMLGHTVTTPTTFVIVLSVGGLGLLIAAGAYRRSSAVLGLLVVEATESLASPVSWSHHFIWMVLLVAWLALAEDRPRYGEWYALGVAVLLWAAPYWWVPHGPDITFAGRGWLTPLGDTYVLVFIVLLVGAAVRVARPTLVRSLRTGTAGHGAVGRGLLAGPVLVRLADEDERVGARVEAALGGRLGVGHPPARHHHELLEVAGLELGAPALVGRLAHQVGDGAHAPGPAHPLRAPPCTWPPSALPGAARSRTVRHSVAAASRVRESSSPSQTKSDAAPASCPASSSAPPSVRRRAVEEVEPDRRRARRVNAQRVQAATLVGLRGRPVDLEPVHATAPETE